MKYVKTMSTATDHALAGIGSILERDSYVDVDQNYQCLPPTPAADYISTQLFNVHHLT
jgi:hypothetical protein